MGRLRDPDVLVVGGGPVGLLTALGLADSGINVEIIDDGERGTVHGYALALHPRSLELLDRFAPVDELIVQGQRIEKVAFYEGDQRQAELRLDRLDSPYPFALAMAQTSLEDALSGLLRRRGIKVRWNHRLSSLSFDGRGIEATVDRLDQVSAGYPVATMSQVVVASTRLRPRVVVGADGHRSTVRRFLDAEFEHLAEARTFLVFEFASAQASFDEMRVVVKDGVTAGLWPLPERRYRWSFELADPILFQPRPDERRLVRRIGHSAYPHVAEERLAELIAYRAPWFDARIDDVLWSIGVRFERRLTSVMGRDGVWLAGDSAHLALPIGMHSMNLGFVEADLLATSISEHLRSPDADRPLTPYPESHRLHLRQQILPEEGFVTTDPADQWVHRHIRQVVECTPATGGHLTDLLAQIGLKPQPVKVDVAG